MTEKDDRPRILQLVTPGMDEVPVPEHWPKPPGHLTETQRARFQGLCARLDEQGTLESADVGAIWALAIAEDNLELVTDAVNEGGRYVTAVKQGRPYKCPTCGGSGIQPPPKGAQPSAPAEPSHPDGRRPGRPCSICGSSQRDEIDVALEGGASVNGTAKRFAVSPDALLRHKRDHLGKPSRQVVPNSGGRVCAFCGGTGGLRTQNQEMVFKHPGVTDQAKLIALVANLSAKLGLDVVSRVRVKGRPAPRRAPSRLQQLANRRGLR